MNLRAMRSLRQSVRISPSGIFKAAASLKPQPHWTIRSSGGSVDSPHKKNWPSYPLYSTASQFFSFGGQRGQVDMGRRACEYSINGEGGFLSKSIESRTYNSIFVGQMANLSAKAS